MWFSEHKDYARGLYFSAGSGYTACMKTTNQPKMSQTQAAWIARQRRLGHSVGKHYVAPSGKLSVRVDGIVYIINRDGTRGDAR